MTTFHTPIEALESADQLYTCMWDFYTFLDSQISNYISKKKLSVACSKGCGICCYIKLDVNAHEVLYLAHYIKNMLPDQMRTRVMADLQRSAKAIAPLNARDHILGRFKCGFLQDNCCVVHPVRPSMCRKFNSMSLELCRQVFSADVKVPPQAPEDQGLEDFATDLIKKFDGNLKMMGYDGTTYEINQAVLMALEKENCMEYWLKKAKILPTEVESKKFSPTTRNRILARWRKDKGSPLTSS